GHSQRMVDEGETRRPVEARKHDPSATEPLTTGCMDRTNPDLNRSNKHWDTGKRRFGRTLSQTDIESSNFELSLRQSFVCSPGFSRFGYSRSMLYRGPAEAGTTNDSVMNSRGLFESSGERPPSVEPFRANLP